MNPTIAGPIESRKAWEDTTSWRLVSIVSSTSEGVVVAVGNESRHLVFPSPIQPNVPAGPAAFSEERGLVALGARSGPVVPLDPGFGVFGLLGGHPEYVFLKVSPGVEPPPDRACSSCGHPQGTPAGIQCRFHSRADGMGAMFRANHFGRIESRADGLAFAGSADRLAAALGDLADAAYPLEATRLVLKYEATLDRFPDSDDRALVVASLGRLVAKADDESLAQRFAAYRETVVAEGHRAAVDKWSELRLI